MLMTEASSPYTGVIVFYCLVAGGVFLLVGLIFALFVDIPAEKKAKEAAGSVAQTTKPGADGKVDAQAQGAISDAAESVGKLAASLKDLSVAARLAMIGVFLVGLAAVAGGADAIGTPAGPSASPVPTVSAAP